MSADIDIGLARLEEQVKALALRVASLEGLVRWLALAVGGAFLTAVIQLVLKG